MHLIFENLTSKGFDVEEGQTQGLVSKPGGDINALVFFTSSNPLFSLIIVYTYYAKSLPVHSSDCTAAIIG